MDNYRLGIFLWSWSLSFMGRAADILEAAAAC